MYTSEKRKQTGSKPSSTTSPQVTSLQPLSLLPPTPDLSEQSESPEPSSLPSFNLLSLPTFPGQSSQTGSSALRQSSVYIPALGDDIDTADEEALQKVAKELESLNDPEVNGQVVEILQSAAPAALKFMSKVFPALREQSGEGPMKTRGPTAEVIKALHKAVEHHTMLPGQIGVWRFHSTPEEYQSHSYRQAKAKGEVVSDEELERLRTDPTSQAFHMYKSSGKAKSAGISYTGSLDALLDQTYHSGADSALVTTIRGRQKPKTSEEAEEETSTFSTAPPSFSPELSRKTLAEKQEPESSKPISFAIGSVPLEKEPKHLSPPPSLTTSAPRLKSALRRSPTPRFAPELPSSEKESREGPPLLSSPSPLTTTSSLPDAPVRGILRMPGTQKERTESRTIAFQGLPESPPREKRLTRKKSLTSFPKETASILKAPSPPPQEETIPSSEPSPSTRTLSVPRDVSRKESALKSKKLSGPRFAPDLPLSSKKVSQEPPPLPSDLPPLEPVSFTPAPRESTQGTQEETTRPSDLPSLPPLRLSLRPPGSSGETVKPRSILKTRPSQRTEQEQTSSLTPGSPPVPEKPLRGILKKSPAFSSETTFPPPSEKPLRGILKKSPAFSSETTPSLLSEGPQEGSSGGIPRKAASFAPGLKDVTPKKVFPKEKAPIFIPEEDKEKEKSPKKVQKPGKALEEREAAPFLAYTIVNTRDAFTAEHVMPPQSSHGTRKVTLASGEQAELNASVVDKMKDARDRSKREAEVLHVPPQGSGGKATRPLAVFRNPFPDMTTKLEQLSEEEIDKGY